MIDKKTASKTAKENYDAIHSYCLSHPGCTENDADEITQEVFLTFQQKCDTLKDINLRLWLYKTAKNKVKEHLRKKEKDKRLTSLSSNKKPTDDMFLYIDKYFEEAEYVSDEYIEKCKELVLKSLKPKEIELYTKVFIENKKYCQVAEEMNVTEKYVGVMVLRLKQKIKALAKLSLSTIGQIVINLFFL